MDCHGNMAAAWALMKARGLDAPPGTVTAELQVRFLKPTPVGGVLHLSARATSVDRDKVAVEGTLESGGVRTATMKGIYVAVRQGHPGFEKWS